MLLSITEFLLLLGIMRRETKVDINKAIMWIAISFFIGFFIFLSVLSIADAWKNSPTDLTININHSADNNTKGLYEALEKQSKEKMTIYSANDCEFVSDKQEYWCLN